MHRLLNPSGFAAGSAAADFTRREAPLSESRPVELRQTIFGLVNAAPPTKDRGAILIDFLLWKRPMLRAARENYVANAVTNATAL
jgi:hypothetical protein